MTLLLLSLISAHARSWCAVPLEVHEWGVQVFSEGERQAQDLPQYFHTEPTGRSVEVAVAVRDLPPDGGERALPVVHFYGSQSMGRTIPVGVDVGFSQGEASAWYPQVDHHRTLAQTRERAAVRARADLVASREVFPHDPIPPDPTRQLVWDALTLSPEPPVEPAPASVPWVEQLREIDALWVSHGTEAERFLFYEGQTTERPALSVERGDTWSADRPHYVLRNTGSHPVHDVFVVDGGRAVFVPSIPAGATAGFLLDQPATDLRQRLRQRLVDTDPEPLEPTWMADGECVMMRNPAVPVEAASGHRLYAPEADALLDYWSERFFRQDQAVILYREDTEALAEAMPLAVYTDMYHFVRLKRAGLVLWEGLDLEALSEVEEEAVDTPRGGCFGW